MSLSLAAQNEIRTLTAEADSISQKTGKVSEQERTRFNFILSRISVIKNGAVAAPNTRSQAELQAEAARVLEETTGTIVPPVHVVNGETRHVEREQAALREYLTSGKEIRTYTGMSIATDSAGGYLVPQNMASKVWTMLKQSDRLFDPDVVTFYESEHGNVLSVPVTDDNSVSAVQIAENATSVEADFGTIDRVSLAKVPTWRSKKMVCSIELLQDSAFPMEDMISANAARRFSKGIGAANVGTLIAGATSGTTSQAAGALSYVDLLNLLGSVDPAYLASPKCYWAMNFATLITIYELKDSQGHPLVRPETDSNGNFLLLTKPVAICPSFDALSVATGKPCAIGDFSRLLVRTVKGYPRLQRFRDAQYLAENGAVAFEMYLRSSSALLVASGSDSPIKYLTLHV
jgi:HK97 family phage major capsid protein